MSQADLNLQLLMTLNDQVSAGMRRMMKDMQGETANSTRKMQELDRAAQKAGSTRMTGLIDSLRSVGREAKNVLDVVSKVGAAALAAGYAVNRLSAKPMAFEDRLLDSSNVAFADRKTKKGRIDGAREIEAGINQAWKLTRAGSREDALTAFDTMMGSGNFKSPGAVLKMLPSVMAGYKGNNADPREVASLVNALKAYGLSDDQIPMGLDIVTAGGQAGGFEIKDAAKRLPKQLGLAKGLGFKGLDGVRRLVAENQVSFASTNDSDSSATNVENLLMKINSPDIAGNIKKQLGGDAASMYAKGVGSGQNIVDVFVGIAQSVAQNDPRLRQLQARAKTLTSEQAKAENIEAQTKIYESSGLAKIIQDQQALTYLVARTNDPERFQSVYDYTGQAAGTNALNLEVKKEGTALKTESVGVAKSIADQTLFDAVVPKSFIDGMTDAAIKFPDLTAAAMGTTYAIGLMAAAAAAFAGMGALSGKGGGLPGAAKTGKKFLVNGGKLALAGGLLSGAAAPVLGAGYAGWEAGGWISDNLLSEKKKDQIGELVARMAAFFGNKEAERALQINLTIDGKQVATVVNAHNAKEAKRR